MTFREVYLVGGLATLGLMNLPRLTGLALDDATMVDPWFPRMTTAS
jgi:hypothetical protein